jgi:glutamine synthetase
MKEYMSKDLVYYIPKENHDEAKLRSLLIEHSEIKFVSMVGVDLYGNDIDERIPIRVFIEDIQTFLNGSIQTDGSSVALPKIATLNNAKVDLVADLDVNWYVDYNYENIDQETGKPIGTLRIPCFLFHEDQPVDSRHILKRAKNYLKDTILDLFKKYPDSLKSFGVKFDDIAEVVTTAGTELEFWVKTPEKKADLEELSTSQVLQEQYWQKTMGSVRTSLEETLIVMDYYNLHPEMGHKEVGGVSARLDQAGNLTHIMEQLEIDWKYSEALQAVDNELLVRMIVKETFRKNGLEVTFLAKPMDGIAGSGEHTHIGIALKLKDGKRVNLFAGKKDHFMSKFGYGAIMGILKNYEVINPMISSTNDSLRRLKPGFEAPVSIVTSLGHSVDMPSRNRTVLVGLVRDLQNPLSTRFELRSPNPHTNSYIALAGIYMSIIDGIKYAAAKSEDLLLRELSKKYNDTAEYLEQYREYRSEHDIFEDYSDEEREKLFGKTPKTVYENVKSFELYPNKAKILQEGNVFNEKLLKSFSIAVISHWITEIERRIIPNYIEELRGYKPLHSPERSSDLDISNWMAISKLIHEIMKDSHSNKSLITRIKDAIKDKNYELVSSLQVELDEKIGGIRTLYSVYKKNLIYV